MSARPGISHLGIDWGLDALSECHGQVRYATDLLTAIARAVAFHRVTVLGTLPKPPTALASLFAPGGGWRWVPKPTASGRGSDWVNQWRGFWSHLRCRPDLLHVIDAPVPAVAPCPVVRTVYDCMWELFPSDYRAVLASRTYRRLRWLCRWRVSRHLAISRTTAEDLHRLWRIPKHRIDVVYLGCSRFPPPGLDDCWRAVLASRFPSLVGRRVVLSPYNLEPRKNLDGLLAAFATVQTRLPGTILALFGKAAWTQEREAQFDSRVASLGIGPAVVRLGPIDDWELATLYRAAEIFVFPSLYEGFGLPLLEAMACGGCVVARCASSMAEVVGDAGLLVETADPRCVAQAIVAVLGDPVEQSRLRMAARTRARSFTANRMAGETIACYSRAIGQS